MKIRAPIAAIGTAATLGITGTIALPALVVTVLQVVSFLVKVVVMIWFLMLIRWTLPRFRYDQAMRLGWMGLFPLSVLNIVVTGALLLALGKA